MDSGGVHLDTVSVPRTLGFSDISLQLNFTSKSGLDTVVATQMNCAPSGLTPAIGESLNRYWVIDHYGAGTFTTNITFSFALATITDTTHPEKYLLYKRDSNSDSTWTFVSSGVAATSNSVTFNGITSFSQFTIIKEGGSSTQWVYKRTISIGGGANLTNYQVMVTLTDNNFNYLHAKPDGSDVRFSLDGSGTDSTTIPHWIEQWNENGVSRIWIKIPSIDSSSGATFYMVLWEFQCYKHERWQYNLQIF